MRSVLWKRCEERIGWRKECRLFRVECDVEDLDDTLAT